MKRAKTPPVHLAFLRVNGNLVAAQSHASLWQGIAGVKVTGSLGIQHNDIYSTYTHYYYDIIGNKNASVVMNQVVQI